MLWLKFGWRNLWRSPRRTVIEITSISGAVFLCMWTVSMQSGMYPKMIEEGTRMGSGHIGFYQKDYLELRRAALTFPIAELMEKLAAEEGVKGVFARVHLPGLARSSRDSRGAAMLGLDLEREKGTNPLLKDKHLAAGRWPKNNSFKEAVMGAGLANELGLKLNRKFVWMTQDKNGEMVSRLFRVCGFIKTGIPDIDKGLVLVARPAAAGILGAPGHAHEVAVLLADYRQVKSFLPRAELLASSMPHVDAVTWQAAMPQIADAIRLDRASGYIFLSLLMLIVGIGTANTMLMSILERVREFGVVRSLGLDRKSVVRMILAEGFVLGLTGSAFGIAAGSLLILYQSRYGFDLTGLMGEKGQEFAGVLIEPILYPAWDWPRVAAIAAIMCLIALTASIYPTLRALGVRPAEAMRRY
ncbi:MAG: FtsX-like permease family protein [Elusimicrobiota bacterium]